MKGTFYTDYTKQGRSWTKICESKVRARFGMSAMVKAKYLSGNEAADWMSYSGPEYRWQFTREKGKTRSVETENALYKFVVKQDTQFFGGKLP